MAGDACFTRHAKGSSRACATLGGSPSGTAKPARWSARRERSLVAEPRLPASRPARNAAAPVGSGLAGATRFASMAERVETVRTQSSGTTADESSSHAAETTSGTCSLRRPSPEPGWAPCERGATTARLPPCGASGSLSVLACMVTGDDGAARCRPPLAMGPQNQPLASRVRGPRAFVSVAALALIGATPEREAEAGACLVAYVCDTPPQGGWLVRPRGPRAAFRQPAGCALPGEAGCCECALAEQHKVRVLARQACADREVGAYLFVRPHREAAQGRQACPRPAARSSNRMTATGPAPPKLATAVRSPVLAFPSRHVPWLGPVPPARCLSRSD